MKIAIIGAGAIGSIVAGYLVKSGHKKEDVLLVGRPDQVDAIRESGLRIKTSEGEETIALNTALKLDQEYDLVIFTVKTQDMEQAYQENHAFLENGLIMTTQNGVQGDTLLSCHFDPDRMIGSIVMFGVTYVKPGEITFNFPGDWIIGKPYTPNDKKLHAVSDVLNKAFPVIVSSDITGMKWVKLFVNFNNCIPALIGKSIQETFSDMDFCKLSVAILKEGLGIVQNAKIELVSLPKFPVERIVGLSQMPEEQAAVIINKTLTTLSKEPLYGSILQSIMRKRISEIDFINGEIVVMAKSVRMESPLNRRVVDLVHQVEREGKFFQPEFVKKEFNLT